MINKLIRISKEKKHLDKKFEESLFIKRIRTILLKLSLRDLKLKNFNVNQREITLYYQHYIGCNEYKTITLTFPSNFYFKKYNILLKYILDNIDDYDLFYNLDIYKESLIKLFKTISNTNKLRIKELNRQLNKLYILNEYNRYIIPIYNKLEFNKIKDELKQLQQFKNL